jgi:hypothetical protein
MSPRPGLDQQREHDESLRFVAQLRDILAKYPS